MFEKLRQPTTVVDHHGVIVVGRGASADNADAGLASVSVRQSAPRVSADLGTGLACGSAGSGLGGIAGGGRLAGGGRGGIAGGGRLAGLRGNSGFARGLPAAGQQVG